MSAVSASTPDADDDLTGQRRTPQLVHDRLRKAIIGGEVAAGSPISQLQLSRQFGISRGPLREALRLLEREGLVEAEPNRRSRIAGFSVPDLEELYAMRISLEALAIASTTPLLQANELERLGELVAQMEQAASDEAYDDWISPHREYHALLVGHAGPRLLAMIQQLSDHAERYRHFYTVRTPKAWLNGVTEHREILSAVQARDAGAASARLARHYSSVVLGLIAALDPEREPSAVRLAARMASAALPTSSESR